MAAGGRRAEIYRQLKDLADEYGGPDPQGLPDIPRRVSGYNLDALLPENGLRRRQGRGRQREHVPHHPARRPRAGADAQGDRARAARLPRRAVVAAYAVPSILPLRAVPARGRGQAARRPRAHPRDARGEPGRPARGRRLAVRRAGRRRRRTRRTTRRSASSTSSATRTAIAAKIVQDDTDEERRCGRSARAGSARPRAPAAPRRPSRTPGRAGRTPPSPPTGSGDYLRDYAALLQRYGVRERLGVRALRAGLRALPDPVRPRSRPAASPTSRRFLHDAAELVTRYGGSLSGEHGDGQARGALLGIMFGEELVEAMRRFRRIWDPAGLMNPGKVVDSNPVDADLRLGAHWHPADPPDLLLPLPGRRRQLPAGRPALRRRRQVPLAAEGRPRHVPELPGDPRGGALDPGPVPAALRDARRARRRHDQGRLALHGGAATRSTSACPARAAAATARCTSTWPPTRPSSSPTTTPAGSGPLVPLLDGLAARLGADRARSPRGSSTASAHTPGRRHR